MSLLNEYETVAAIATCGGISQGAEFLGLSQPTLSKKLKKIEENVGATLFDRSAVPLRPTEAGKLFLETGEKVLDLDRQFKKRLKEIRDSENTVIRIGISPSRAPYMLPSLLSAYRCKKPNGKIIIEERTSAELSSRLSRGELDLIISMLDEGTECFSQIPLFYEHMLLAIPASQSSTNVEEAIRTLPFITVGQGQAMWKTATSILQDFGARTAAIECQSIESGLSLVEQGLGAMIVPSYISEFGAERRESIRFLPLPPYEGRAHRRTICLFYRKGQFLTQAERDFISCLDNIRSIK